MQENFSSANHSLDLIETFMRRFYVEAVARGDEPLTEGQKKSLQRLAAGELDSEERNALIPLLAKNTTAMEYLSSLGT